MSTIFTIDMDTELADGVSSKSGFFSRLIEARIRRGEAYVSHYLSRQSDSSLAGLGFTLEQVKSFRMTGRMPNRVGR